MMARIFFSLLLILLLALGSCANRPTAGITEVYVFRTATGVTDAQLIDAAASVDPTVAALPGYLGRQLYRGANGSWIDMVHWRTPENAEHASTAVQASEQCLEFFSLSDEKSVTRHKPERVPPR